MFLFIGGLKSALRKVSPRVYECPSCLTKKAYIVREDTTFYFFFLPIYSWSSGNKPYYKCFNDLCDWSNYELRLNEDQLEQRRKLYCKMCRYRFDNEEYRFCPLCGEQRTS
ncbi:hypothetical protein K502DRAFT_362914 [Neoconidiobolus thromboides FSU 785]|nr:hypothetical protein K502DRAFT_362914 [Neoconidiobolus thromboides FSU 785]